MFSRGFLSNINPTSKIWLMVCRESVVNFLSRVPSWFSCCSAIVPLLVFCWSKIFCRGYFVEPTIFSCGYFVGPKVVGISWVRNFFSLVFRGSNFFRMANFQRQTTCEIVTENINTETHLKTSNVNRFQQLSITYIRKMLHLLN